MLAELVQVITEDDIPLNGAYMGLLHKPLDRAEEREDGVADPCALSPLGATGYHCAKALRMARYGGRQGAFRGLQTETRIHHSGRYT
jgi:hypothetical protein